MFSKIWSQNKTCYVLKCNVTSITTPVWLNDNDIMNTDSQYYIIITIQWKIFI